MQELVAYMNGELVGRLQKQTNGAHSFKYDPSWIDSDKARPLSLSLKLQLNSKSQTQSSTTLITFCLTPQKFETEL